MQGPCEYLVKCYINATQDFYHMSKLHGGLFQLRKRGVIAVEFVGRKPVGGLTKDPPWTPWLEIQHIESRERRLAVIDLSDRSDFFYLEALRCCDVYYKRNLHERDLESLEESDRLKVQPFGLNYACRTDGQASGIVPRVVVGLTGRLLRSIRPEMRSLPARISAIREFLGVLRIEDYEQPPDGRVEQVVFFQARASQPSGQRGNEEEWINRPRVDLVRALRKEFGRRFWGGLVPNEYAIRTYPDAITDLSPHRAEYITQSKRALVGVASPPCVQTGSFKIAEYLAASKCIVSPPVAKILPVPLLDNVHYRGFENVDECVAQCALLLGDSSLAEEMRHNNWGYYRREVAPAAHIENLLRRAFHRTPA